MQAFACDMSEHVGTGMGAALTLALIGTVNGRWHPWLLVEAGAALVTGGPTCVVLAGALKPGGTMVQQGLSVPRRTQEAEASVDGKLRQGMEWSVQVVPACRPAWSPGSFRTKLCPPRRGHTSMASPRPLGHL